MKFPIHPSTLCRQGRRAARWLAACLLAAGSAAANGVDAHYVVVRIAADGLPVVVARRRVELAGIPAGTGLRDRCESSPAADRHRFQVEVLRADGSVGWETMAAAQPGLRLEVPGEPIASLNAVPEERWLVLRVPASAGETLHVRAADGAGPGLLLDLGAPVAVQATEARVAALAAPGDPANRLDLLIVGDGYTAAEEEAFAVDAAALAGDLFAFEPLAAYRPYFNVTSLFVASPESGADHPPYDPACPASSRTCCPDVAASSDPRAGQFRETAFDARFCTQGIHRLLTVATDKVLVAAWAVPDWDIILALVNDPVYGGSGGRVAVASRNEAGAPIMLHELGHAFAGLADEYDSATPGYPPCSDATGPPCEPNVTDLLARDEVKWRGWIAAETPLPTPETGSWAGVVGLFEGARYRAAGMYRPVLSCLMRNLASPYCPVCAQEWVLSLYRGGWGVPAAGIRLIEPGRESPVGSTVAVAEGVPVTFSVEILAPASGPAPAIEWFLDGEPLAQGSASVQVAAPAGVHQVLVRVSDRTPLVRGAGAGEVPATTREWTLEVNRAGRLRRRLKAGF